MWRHRARHLRHRARRLRHCARRLRHRRSYRHLARHHRCSCRLRHSCRPAWTYFVPILDRNSRLENCYCNITIGNCQEIKETSVTSLVHEMTNQQLVSTIFETIEKVQQETKKLTI